MNYLAGKLRTILAKPEHGATAVEYGLMVALIAVVIIGAVTLLGTQILALFTDVAGKFS
jgi:pilus assembly protein Flp/PilA